MINSSLIADEDEVLVTSDEQLPLEEEEDQTSSQPASSNSRKSIESTDTKRVIDAVPNNGETYQA